MGVQMIMAKVLVGEYAPGNKFMVVPPKVAQSERHYDSTTNDPNDPVLIVSTRGRVCQLCRFPSLFCVCLFFGLVYFFVRGFNLTLVADRVERPRVCHAEPASALFAFSPSLLGGFAHHSLVRHFAICSALCLSDESYPDRRGGRGAAAYNLSQGSHYLAADSVSIAHRRVGQRHSVVEAKESFRAKNFCRRRLRLPVLRSPVKHFRLHHTLSPSGALSPNEVRFPTLSFTPNWSPRTR